MAPFRSITIDLLSVYISCKPDRNQRRWYGNNNVFYICKYTIMHINDLIQRALVYRNV